MDVEFQDRWALWVDLSSFKNRLYRTFTKNSVTFVLFLVYIIERQKSEDAIKG